MILLISASQIARILGLSRQHLASEMLSNTGSVLFEVFLRISSNGRNKGCF
jgi:hypothetical protein